MKIDIATKGKVNILRVTGNLTFGGDAVLRQEVVGLLDGGGRLFLFNLLGVPFIDSVGLGETVACTKRICERGGAIKLVLAEDGKVHQVFKITGLDRAYEIFTDEQEALVSWIP